MAVTTSLHTLSTTPKLVATGRNANVQDRTAVLVSSPSADVFVGGVAVTSSNGALVATGTALSIDLGPDDDLYAVASSGTPTVRILTTRAGYIAP